MYELTNEINNLVTEGVQMVRDLQQLQDDIEDKLHNTELSLFKNSYDYEERNK